MFKRNLKRAITIAMTACLMVGAAAGCGKKEENNGTTSAPTQAADNGNTGSTDNSGNGGTAATTYTYNMALSVFPTNWNPHTYQTATDKDVLKYISSGFYVFDYNETLDGYKLIPGMAVAEPVDVTAEYVGKYGIAEGDKAKAWKITLRDDLKWEDGTPINAHDFVTSTKLLLDPVAQNYRADSLYSGDLAVYGAKDYLYQGKHVYATSMVSSDYTTGYIAPADYKFTENGVLYANDNTDNDVAVSINGATPWGSNPLSKYYNSANYKSLFSKDGVDLYATVLEANADENGMVPATQEVIDAMNYIVAGLNGAASAEEYAASAGDYAYQEWQEFAFTGATYGEMNFEDVGVFATADNELVLAIEKPLEGFYLRYALTDCWLVKEDLYNSCITVKDGVYNNTYGTKAENTPSYGPYKLTSFQADKQYVLSKNENFYGLNEDTYQTTAIQVDYIAEASTRLSAFLSGQLDSYVLSADDMAEYQASDYTYYTNEASTFFIALNPNLEALVAAQEAAGTDINKTILTIKEFRMALSFALDRAKLALAIDPTGPAAFGVFNPLIVANPDTGDSYRSTDVAKDVLVDFWGLSGDVGEGKMYATKDEAIESITGYNLTMAKSYFDQAYDIAIAEGLMDDNDKVVIKIGTPNSTSAYYSKGYEFLTNCYTEAVKGTKLEGKLEFTLDNTLGNGFADALRANQVDMLFGVGWNGSELDPYGLIEAYTGEQYQYDPAWNTAEADLTINLNGVDYTATVWDWTMCLAGTKITIKAADGTTKEFSAGSSDDIPEERLVILAALEGAVLSTYDMIPMLDEAAANLKGMQVEYYTEDYIFGVGRHNEFQYLKYNYTDAEWDEFVASQGGVLNYK